MAGRRMHPPERVADYTARSWWTAELVDELFQAQVAARGAELAAVDPPNRADLMDGAARRWSWSELDAEVDRIAEVLLDNAIGQGDVVGIQLPNTVELILTYLALWRIGAIASPLPVQYREHEIVGMGTRAQFRAFVTTTRGGGQRRLADEFASYRPLIPTVESLLVFGADPPAGSVAVDTVVAETPSRVRDYVASHPGDPNDCLTICWTSGTESAPKGVPRAHYEWLAMSWSTVEAPAMTSADVLLNPFPLVNMAGINGMLLPWLRTGAVLVQHHPFSLEVFLRQIQTERVTYTVAPPALLALLVQDEQLLAQADISSLTRIGSGSAPLQEWMVRAWSTRFGIDIINFFGSNEGTALMTDPVLMTDPEQRARFFPRYGGGRQWSFRAADWMSIKLVDVDTGKEVTQPGHPGELHIKGPTVFAGYLNADEVASPFDRDGYLRTGDVFVIAGEQQQYLEYVDRAKDMIIRGGMNIAPAELEGLIGAHPAVREVAVVGLPDDLLGERVCAVVVLQPPLTVTLAELLGYLSEQRIASYKLPERLVELAALPRNPVGKVLKRELRSVIAAEAERSTPHR